MCHYPECHYSNCHYTECYSDDSLGAKTELVNKQFNDLRNPS